MPKTQRTETVEQNQEEVELKEEAELELPKEAEERSFELPDDPFDDLKDTQHSVEDDLINSVLRTETSAAAIAERQSALILETGLYRWVKDEWKVTVYFAKNDVHATDVGYQKGLGRCYIKAVGNVENAETGKKGGVEFDFTCSPDIRYRDGKLDYSSKYYGQAEEFYFNVKKQKPTPFAVKELLESGEYAMYITRGNSRNFFKSFQKLNT